MTVEPAEATDDAVDPPSVQERVVAACEALTELYERLERRLRETDDRAIGWGPQLAALRAMRDQQVAGDWDELARLLVSADASDDLIRDGAISEVVQDVLADGGRALVLAPTDERAAEAAQAAGDEVFALLVTPAPEPPPVPRGQDATRAESIPPAQRPSAPPAEGGSERRADGSNRTIEFKPVTSADLTRPQEVPDVPDVGTAGETPMTGVPAPVVEGSDGRTAPLAEVDAPDEVDEAPEQPAEVDERAPEARVRSVVVRPVGEAWRNAWTTEARMLQRGLMWLEQWPRDLATLESLEADRERRRENLDTELAGLATRIEELEAAVEAAEQAGVRAADEAERLTAARAEIATELEAPLAEAQRLQADADAKADEAGRLTRTAQATLARCDALEERNARAQAELQAARQEEASLTTDLARAREDLPRVAQEADRLMADSAAADAEGHTRYYRLAAAESALGARRRKMSLGQRLHVAPPPAELKRLRAEVKALIREADSAAKRAAEAKEAADRAQGYRTQLEAFIDEGGSRLTAAQEAQQQLGTELTRLAKERTAATADHQEKAQQAAEAVNVATRASALAVEAQRVAQEIEGRLAAARQEQEDARAANERALAEAEAAKTRLSETEALLAQRRVEAERELSSRAEEFEAATAAEARSRGNVEEICGGSPIDRERLVTHQRRAMTRIEQLSGLLDRAGDGFDPADEAGEVLLRAADLVCGTPPAVGAALRDMPEAGFDALVVPGAGALNEADFLVGAVRTRRWVLLDESARTATPPAYPEYEGHADGERLSRSPFSLP